MLCLNLSDITIITVKALDYPCIRTLANLKQLIYQKIICLKIMGIYKMHTKKMNIENQVHYHYEKLTKPKKIETRNIFIDKKSYRDLVIYFTR